MEFLNNNERTGYFFNAHLVGYDSTGKKLELYAPRFSSSELHQWLSLPRILVYTADGEEVWLNTDNFQYTGFKVT